ncbi:putative T7SS-secreted protein [Saccharopolyspora sp. NPDC002376]
MAVQDAVDDSLVPIRGNNLGIEGECTRLKGLADHLESTGRKIWSLRADTWDGRAREYFDDARFAMGKNWLNAADAHYKAAAKLHQYRVTLEDVQLFAASAMAEARECGFAPAVVENSRALIARWQHQLDEVGVAAAAAIREANETIVGLRRVLSEPEPVVSPSPSIQLVATPQPEVEPRRSMKVDLPSPYGVFGNVSAHYQQQLSALNAAVLDSWLT